MSTPSTLPEAANSEPIIEARKLEKFYPQPDGGRIRAHVPDVAVLAAGD